MASAAYRMILASRLRAYCEGGLLQQIGMALPQGDGSVVFALNSTITDAISGMFSGVVRQSGNAGPARPRSLLRRIRRSVDTAPGRRKVLIGIW